MKKGADKIVLATIPDISDEDTTTPPEDAPLSGSQNR